MANEWKGRDYVLEGKLYDLTTSKWKTMVGLIELCFP